MFQLNEADIEKELARRTEIKSDMLNIDSINCIGEQCWSILKLAEMPHKNTGYLRWSDDILEVVATSVSKCSTEFLSGILRRIRIGTSTKKSSSISGNLKICQHFSPMQLVMPTLIYIFVQFTSSEQCVCIVPTVKSHRNITHETKRRRKN